MHIGKYIDLIHRTEVDLAKAFKTVAKAHGDEVDVYQTCMLLSSWSQVLADDMAAKAEHYKGEDDTEPDRLAQTLLKDPRKGSMALLRDLHDVYLIVTEVQISCTIVQQAATGLRDEELMAVCSEIERQTKRQLAWLLTRMKASAPQILIVAE